MAYVPPSFNMFCTVYDAPAPTDGGTILIRTLNQPCQLRFSPGAQGLAHYYGQAAYYSSGSLLLVPALTDIRDWRFSSSLGDIVECPIASGCFWAVAGVADVGKGFMNEYRVAELVPLSSKSIWPNFPDWPIPMP